MAEQAHTPQGVADLRLLLATDWGRRLAHWMVYELGALESVAMRSRPLGYEVANIKDGKAAQSHSDFFDGRRDMAAALLSSMWRADPAGTARMQQEFIETRLARLAALHTPTEQGETP